jgi:DNA-binding NarL/FixJ family response regulator
VTNAINILIASPKGLMLDLLKVALSASPRFRVVAHINAAEEIAEVISRESIDIALVSPALAVATPKPNLFRRLLRELPNAKLIALLELRDRDVIVDAFRQGARGVISLPHVEFELLCRCVDCVQRGQIWASNEEIGWVMNAFETTQNGKLNIVDAAGTKLLTSREEEVVLLVMDGLSNRDIATTLQLSEHTVKNYMFHVFDKLGVSSRTELVAYATSSSRKCIRPSSRQAAVTAARAASSIAALSASARRTPPRPATFPNAVPVTLAAPKPGLGRASSPAAIYSV